MSKKSKENKPQKCTTECPYYNLPKVRGKKIILLPWIADGSYLSDEYQRKISETLDQIRDRDMPSGKII